MIVTRRRRKAFPWKRVVLPLLAVGLLVAAIVWPPSQQWLATGPFAPLWRSAQPVAAPFHFAAQNRAIADRTREIATLRAQVADAKAQITDRDKQISSLRTQVNQLQTQAALAQSPARASVSSVPAPQSTSAAFGDLAQGATQDMRRTAQEWGAMDADAAAKVVQKLPLPYVAHIFALMSPDSAGAILEALPPAYAASLTQEHPELRR
ncbi:MAG TPA: hypothetical protein VIG51_03165 [Candidatus Baltobacteraceae bacterium]